MLGTTVMPITVYSRLPVVQYGCRVVYFGEWDANGDYIDMYCNDWLPETGRPYRLAPQSPGLLEKSQVWNGGITVDILAKGK